jgi:hypothetical protein
VSAEALPTGLTAAYDYAVGFFAEQDWPCLQEFGWRVVDHKIDETENYNRIYWSPGDNANAGTWGPARYPGQAPRSLGTLYEFCTVTICAYDRTQPDVERAQYEATIVLAKQWLNAMHYASPSNITYVSQRWLDRQKLRSKGAALQIVWNIQTVVQDLVAEAAVDTLATQAPIDVTLVTTTTEHWVERVTATVAQHATPADILLEGLQGFADDDCCLVLEQANPIDNGLWQVRSDMWIRSPIQLVNGLLVEVIGAGQWSLVTPDPVVIGSSDIVFAKVG